MTTSRTRLILAGAVALALVLWLILRDGDDDNGKTGTNAGQIVPRNPGLPPVLLNTQSLKSYAAGQSTPVYWIGPLPDRRYEVTRTADGSTYIRYLPTGVKPGDPRPSFLTVGSYPNNDAVQAVRNAGSQAGNSITKVPGGAEAVTNDQKPGNSIYLAFTNNRKVLIEVWDPKPGRSLQLVRSGAVVPVR